MAGNNRIRTTLYHLVLVERIAHSLKLQFRLWRETYQIGKLNFREQKKKLDSYQETNQANRSTLDLVQFLRD
ncbi:hypothetical protein C1N32_06530 [Vibrio diazotrophicus]|uniref:Uncharacterized protein n=1 Tax=Vibrio diazotrophicus TaxID=685 RepID=A0A2J8I5F7_VIBDI|nr:hypothetical protein C1N32_06530 [Vibrio diazotrophicus]